MSIANELERYMLELVNQERTSRGLDALILETNLNEAADIHSQWMTDADTFSHTGANNSSPTARMTAADMDLSGSWGTAENIAAVSVQGTSSYFDEVQQLHTNLMNSSGHRANILNPDLEYVGIGIVLGPLTYQGNTGPITLNSVLVTQNFARTEGISDLDMAGGAGNDFLRGSTGDDVINGEGGADNLRGERGHDTLMGEGGDDTLEGGRGNDTLDGGAGDDVLNGQRNADTIDGGEGHDVIRGGGGSDVIRGGSGNDEVIGGGRRDTVEGGGGNDTLNGNAADDILNGGSGHDLLRGGGDNDTLNGGTGNDDLRGGDGADRFVFDVNHGQDVVTDLEVGIDTIQISRALAAGRDAATLVNLGSVVGGDFVLETSASSQITFEGITSTAGLADMIDIL